MKKNLALPPMLIVFDDELCFKLKMGTPATYGGLGLYSRGSLASFLPFLKLNVIIMSSSLRGEMS